MPLLVPLLVLRVVFYFVVSVPYLVLVPMPVIMLVLVLVLGVLVLVPLLLYVPMLVASHVSHQRHSLPSIVLPGMLDFLSYLTSTKP